MAYGPLVDCEMARKLIVLWTWAWFGPVRLTGVSGQELVGERDQMELFRPEPGRRQRLNAALDQIASRYGNAAVTTADLAEAGESAEPRGGGHRR